MTNHLAALCALVACAGQASAQSFTIDPDGLGETNVTVDASPFSDLNQLVPGSTLTVGFNPVGSLLFTGPWQSNSDFTVRVGFSSTLRLEGGVDLQNLGIAAPAQGGTSSTIPGRLELDGSSLSAAWVFTPGTTNALEYRLENDSFLELDFGKSYNGGDGFVPFEVGLTPASFTITRAHDLRVTSVPTGSTLRVKGSTQITRASGADVASNGHNVIIDGGTWDTNRLKGQTLGDPSLAEGGIDFRSGIVRVRDVANWRYFDLPCAGEDYWDSGQYFNQDDMDALLAGIGPGTPAVPQLVSGQTLEILGRNEDYAGAIEPCGLSYMEVWNSSYIASTLEIRGGRLQLGPDGSWNVGPEGIDFTSPVFSMVQRGFVLDLDSFDSVYSGAEPVGPIVLDGGQFDFANVRFTDLDDFGNTYISGYFLPQLRSGMMRGANLSFVFEAPGHDSPLRVGAAGKVLTCVLGSIMTCNIPLRIEDGATVEFLSEGGSPVGTPETPRYELCQLQIGDGAIATFMKLSFYCDGGPAAYPPIEVGLNSSLQIETLDPGYEYTAQIGADSLVEVGAYRNISLMANSTFPDPLSIGPGTLRLMAGALADLAPKRRAFTVGGTLELDPAGTLAFDLLTAPDATRYNVGGDLHINGCGLSVTLADELFTPGEQVLMNIDGTTTGTFAGFPEGTLVESRLGVDLYLSYTGGDGNDIVLTSTPPTPSCPGDISGDGSTNSADFNILAGNFGNAVVPNTGGDLNGDGIVNTADFVILAGDFGCGL